MIKTKTREEKTQDKITPNNTMRHDSFIKQSMSYPKVAREVFEAELPKNIIEQVDLDSLNELKTDFIDTTTGRSQADVLFSVKHKNGKTGYFYILLEGQSSVDNFMTIRMLKYMICIYEMHAKKYPDEKTAPLVYPMLLYAGQNKYTGNLSYWQEFNNIEDAKLCFPAPMHIINLQNTKNSEIDLKNKYYRGIFYYILKNIYSKDIYKTISDIQSLLKFLGKELRELRFFGDIVYFVLTTANNSDDKDKLIQLFKESVNKKDEGKIMTIADQLKEAGREEGIVLGMEKERMIMIKNMLNNNISMNTISTITNLSATEIEKYKKKLDTLQN